MDYNNIIDTAKQLVMNYTNSNIANTYDGEQITKDEVYVVWYCKTLQNVKLLLSTPLPDGMYYEATYNGDADEIYFDAYRKVDNITVKAEG